MEGSRPLLTTFIERLDIAAAAEAPKGAKALTAAAQIAAAAEAPKGAKALTAAALRRRDGKA
jgi:hypothetical protein